MNNLDEFSRIVKKYKPNFKYRDYYYYGITFRNFYKEVMNELEENEQLMYELRHYDIKDRIFNKWRGFNMEELIKEELSYYYKVESSKKLDNIGVDILIEEEEVNICIQVKSSSFLKFDLEEQRNYIIDTVTNIDKQRLETNPNKRFKFILILYDKENLYYSTHKDIINYDPRTKTIRTHEIVEIDNIYLGEYLKDIIEDIKEP